MLRFTGLIHELYFTGFKPEKRAPFIGIVMEWGTQESDYLPRNTTCHSLDKN